MQKICFGLCLAIFSLAANVSAHVFTQNARIVDGTGVPEFVGSVRIDANRISATGHLAPSPGDAYLSLTGFNEKIRRAPVSVNIASFSGHNSIRREILGKNFSRHANDAEIKAMVSLLRADMNAGALGLATELEYEPGMFTATEEVIVELRRPDKPIFSGMAIRWCHHAAYAEPYFGLGCNPYLPVNPKISNQTPRPRRRCM